jgi:hypothetical protein
MMRRRPNPCMFTDSALAKARRMVRSKQQFRLAAVASRKLIMFTTIERCVRLVC